MPRQVGTFVNTKGTASGKGTLPFLFLLDGICPDLAVAHFIETLDILPDIGVIGFPIVQVAKQQMMISPLEFAESDEIIRIEFQIGMQMKRFDVMDLQPLSSMAAGPAGRLFEKMLVSDGRPLRTTFDTMLARDNCPIIPLSRYRPPLCAPGLTRRGNGCISHTCTCSRSSICEAPCKKPENHNANQY